LTGLVGKDTFLGSAAARAGAAPGFLASRSLAGSAFVSGDLDSIQ
jgi:hypothetical protein